MRICGERWSFITHRGEVRKVCVCLRCSQIARPLVSDVAEWTTVVDEITACDPSWERVAVVRARLDDVCRSKHIRISWESKHAVFGGYLAKYGQSSKERITKAMRYSLPNCCKFR